MLHDTITSERKELGVQAACVALGVSRAWYIEQLKQARFAPGKDILLQHLRDIALEFPRYGYRRITAELRRQEVIVNHKKVLKIMKKHGFNPIIKYKERETTRRQKPRKLTTTESKKYKRHRGLVETVFGGTETEHGNKTCFRLVSQRYKDSKLLSLAHNIKTYYRALASNTSCVFTYLIDKLPPGGFV